MLDSPRGRLAALSVLLAVLFGLLVWYGSLGPAPALGNYPSEEHFGPHPDRYVGDRVATTGRVVATDPVRIEVRYGADRRATYAVTGLDGSVAPGRRLRVFGRLVDPETVEAENAFTVPDSGLWYAWGISFFAGLWTLSRIVRHWRIDREGIALVARERPAGPPVVDGGADDGGGDGGA